MSYSGRRAIVAGNWKMYKTRGEASQLAQEIKTALVHESNLPEVILVPPYTALAEVINCVNDSPLAVGAQNMDYRDSGAFTGEISPPMLVDIGVKYVLIGHSERRQYFGETNASVNLKVKAALVHELEPIICVGESLDEREADLTDAVVGRQVGAALTGVDPQAWLEIVFAYEPVWAIGTGKHCEATEANRVANLIRSTLFGLLARMGAKGTVEPEAIPVLYGGSVKPSNIEEIMQQVNIDGVLVGGASLVAADFLALVQAVQKRVKLNLSATTC